jgi:hypothetical protein
MDKYGKVAAFIAAILFSRLAEAGRRKEII